MSKYPLIEAMGLEIKRYSVDDHVLCVQAEDLERVLAAAPTVNAHAGPSTRGLEHPVWIAKGWHDADSTHTAKLLCIEPIAPPDTAEQILRDLIETADSVNQGPNPTLSVGYYVERARKLLGGFHGRRLSEALAAYRKGSE